MKVGNRASMGMLVIVCLGTGVGLVFTSAAKKANLLGPQRTITIDQVEERLKAVGK
jgi:hypothetical protein